MVRELALQALTSDESWFKDYRTMSAKLELTLIGSVLSDASRVSMVRALLDGRSLTARELSHGAGITPQTASFHLKKLAEAGLVLVLPQGRHRFFRLASPQIAEAMRTLMDISPDPSVKPAAKKQNAVCFARTCYGHLAGRLGVAVAEAMETKGFIRRRKDDEFVMTPSGISFLAQLGIERSSLKKSRRRFASQCLDWSERHPHIGGALGHALTEEFKSRRWIKTKPGSRDISVTLSGQEGLQSLFNIDVDQLKNSFFGSEL